MTSSNQDTSVIMGSGENLVPAELFAQSLLVWKWDWLAFHNSIGEERNLLPVA